jgi:CelD/BcsL family acetyltransferase involved in cellulose biosynthesis
MEQVGYWLRELPALFEPSDLIWQSEEGLWELARMLVSQGLPLVLGRVPADSPTIMALRKAHFGRGLLRAQPAMQTPFIPLHESQPGVEYGLNAGRRSDLRRAERRARKFGAVDFELHSPSTLGELAPLVDDVLEIEAHSWKQAAGTSLAADGWQRQFFDVFLREVAPSGMLRIAFMRIGGRRVAMQVALDLQQRFWLLKISHAEAYSSCSPGQLLLQYTLDHAMQSGYLSYEFMGVMADWTRLWTRFTRHYLQIQAIPFSAVSGRAVVGSCMKVLRGVRRPTVARSPT